MKKLQCHSARIVADEKDDEQVVDYVGQLAVEQVTWNGIHHKRFYIADQSPICQGPDERSILISGDYD